MVLKGPNVRLKKIKELHVHGASLSSKFNVKNVEKHCDSLPVIVNGIMTTKLSVQVLEGGWALLSLQGRINTEVSQHIGCGLQSFDHTLNQSASHLHCAYILHDNYFAHTSELSVSM